MSDTAPTPSFNGGIPTDSGANPNGTGIQPSWVDNVDTGATQGDYQAILDGAQARSAESTAQMLANRRAQKDAGQRESVQSIDLQVSLESAQAELHAARKAGASHARISQLEQKAYSLAEQLVSGANSAAPTNYESSADQSDDAPDSFDDGFDARAEIIGKHSEAVVTETLQWAADSLDRSTAEAFNKALEANDQNSAAAFEQLRQIQQRPELIADEESFSEITPELVNELTSQFGEHGKKLGLLSFGIRAGKISRGKAAQMVMADPELAMTALTAARQGLITLAL